MIFNNPNFSFVNFFTKLIPNYIKQNDTYKDANGMGLFERYFALFGENLDEEKCEQIENYLNIIDPQISPEKFLNHISDSLGNPPDVFQDIEQYRNLLTYIVSIYKVKGTIIGYEIFFSLLGFNIEIYEIPLLNTTSNYDQDGTYDLGEDNLYDQNVCRPCSFYTIKFYYTNNSEVLSSNTLGLLREAITFNEPINAKLKSLVIVLNLEDTQEITIVDFSTDITLESIPAYDNEHLYDEEIPTGTTFDDWYLGSMLDMDRVYQNVIKAPYNLGDMNISGAETYWTSSEFNFSGFPVAYVRIVNSGATAITGNKGDTYLVRAVRDFTTTGDLYNLRDLGPAGGYIFHKVDLGTGDFKYWELGLENLTPSVWSNITSGEVGTSTAIGSGQTNSDSIMSQSGHINSAALLCSNYSVIVP